MTITCTRSMDVHKKDNFMVSVNTCARWVKPAQPAKPIFLTPTLLMRSPAEDVG